ncbi:MAG: invasion associated locus B family protein, partial [Lysobacterales bacterium]
VAEITLFEFPKGQEALAGATVAVPLGTLLTRQVTISVDSGSAKRYPFSWCSVQGCYARIGFTTNDLRNLKRGANAYVTIVPFASPSTQVRLTLSLTGFTKGFAALQVANEATTSQ